MRLTPAVLCLCAALGWGACQSKTIDNSMPTGPDGPVSFSADVLPLFAQSCAGAGCHIGMRTSGVELTTYRDVVESVGQQYGQAVVVPGDAAASPLLDKLGPQPQFGVRMPRGRAPLAAADIALVRAWVDEGAEDN